MDALRDQPILSTAAVPPALKKDTLSVFDLEMPRPHAASAKDETALGTWEMLKRLRAVVAASDTVRDFQLQAHVSANPHDAETLRHLGDNLRETLIVSAADVKVDASLDAPDIVLAPAEGEKCARCWKYLPLRSDPLHSTLCAPCAAIVRDFDAAAPASPN